MEPVTAQVSKHVDAPPSDVWKAITDPVRLKRFFFGAEVESSWEPGDPIRMRGEFKGKAYEDKGEIREAAPGKRLSFSHYSPLSGAPDKRENYHVVTFDLDPDGEGSKVTLSQSNLDGTVKASDKEHRAEYEKNWQGVLDGLAKEFAH
jgi:uncharacterized protein YndB with AHSA1/START domain